VNPIFGTIQQMMELSSNELREGYTFIVITLSLMQWHLGAYFYLPWNSRV